MAGKDDKEKLEGGTTPPKPVPPSVTFSKEQIELIGTMMKDLENNIRSSMDGSRSPNQPISMYNMRDPKEIKSVKVSRFDAKWVTAFKNLQNDPYKKNIPKYLRYGPDPIRKLNNEPFVTLVLSSDGKEFEEKEIMLIDYMENRDQVDVPVKHVEIKEIINDHGVLSSTGNYAIEVDDKGNPTHRPTILAQSKSVEREFTVHLEGFEDDTVFKTDFLG